MLVEDNPVIQYSTKKILNYLGCQVDTVSDGYTALRLANHGYHLIILDIGLPDISGICVVKELCRTFPNFNVPIIAHTACGESIKKKCMEVGMSDFTVKPVAMHKFEKLLERWIPHYSSFHKG